MGIIDEIMAAKAIIVPWKWSQSHALHLSFLPFGPSSSNAQQSQLHPSLHKFWIKSLITILVFIAQEYSHLFSFYQENFIILKLCLVLEINIYIFFSMKNIKEKWNIIKILYILKLFNFYIKSLNKWKKFEVVYKIIY